MRHVCLIGAGFIARTHAAALRATPGVQLAGVADPDGTAAAILAKTCGIPRVFADGAEALRAGGFDCAHVLTPPDRHAEAALPWLKAGLPVLAEKPLAASGEECAALLAAAAGTPLGVSHNFVHHPAFTRLRRAVDSGGLGRPRFVDVLANLPLRQMAARRFGHWMFARPVNLLLEQAVHPLSQIVALAGPVEEIQAQAGPATEPAPGIVVVPEATLSLRCRRLPAHLHLALGRSFPFWEVRIVCDDGVAVADILGNRFTTHQHTGAAEALDCGLSGVRTAAMLLRDTLGNAAAYARGLVMPARRQDSFTASVTACVRDFHRALDRGTAPETDGVFGAHVVGVCEEVARQAFPPPARPRPLRSTAATADVCVLGGTGFIGTHLVRHLAADGLRVAVMARDIRALPEPFHHPRVSVTAGSVGDPAAVEAAIGSARLVVNLAHGGATGDWHAVRDAMVGGARIVARACLARGVERLVHVGSVASLYLGPQRALVTGATLPDPRAHQRADYARAKAECDRLLLALHAAEGLKVVILRPAVVIGEGGTPFPSALGTFHREQHCLGWNAGTNPLPFVLAEDVAAAVALAGRAAKVDGRCYNLAGLVRPSAREYLALLADTLGRPLRFHPSFPLRLWLEDMAKGTVKAMGGRPPAWPSWRDLASRGMEATLDCSDAMRDLGWQPENDVRLFIERGIRVHGGR